MFERDENIGIAYGIGITAENVAKQWQILREPQDEFALQSHLRALKAQQAGEFSDEMTPVDLIDRLPNLAGNEHAGEQGTQTRTVSLDEGPRADTSLEGLARLRPVFAAKGSVTAGNSSPTSDGAGALILASERAVKEHGLTPLARFVSFASRGVPPEIMGIGPIEAIPAAHRSRRRSGRLRGAAGGERGAPGGAGAVPRQGAFQLVAGRARDARAVAR